MNWNALTSSIVAVVMCLTGLAVADLETGNKLYDAGRFAEAAAVYQQIEPKTANVHFNLGNALFREGQLGRAVASYERARRLSPRDPDILANLKFAENRLGVELLNVPVNPVKRFVHSAVMSRTLGEWSVYELGTLWLAAIGLGVWMWSSRARTVWLNGVVAMSVLWVSVTAALAYRLWLDRTLPAAVVVSKSGAARFAPLADATVHFPLQEGLKVAVREDRGNWLLVQRADGQQGWVPASDLEKIGL
jgi:tetratricopeptide (TPR) repeat protein